MTDIFLSTPFCDKDIRDLRCGDRVLLSGSIVTARDVAHKYLADGGKPPCSLNVIYHCGPLVCDGKVIAAGPTTSLRQEPYEAKVIADHGVRAVIGKSGMGAGTRKALIEHGCVYLSVAGGAGALAASKIKRVIAVHMLEEFGAPEAFWELEVEDFPAIVTMDSHGDSIHDKIQAYSKGILDKILNQDEDEHRDP